MRLTYHSSFFQHFIHLTLHFYSPRLLSSPSLLLTPLNYTLLPTIIGFFLPFHILYLHFCTYLHTHTFIGDIRNQFNFNEVVAFLSLLRLMSAWVCKISNFLCVWDDDIMIATITVAIAVVVRNSLRKLSYDYAYVSLYAWSDFVKSWHLIVTPYSPCQPALSVFRQE